MPWCSAQLRGRRPEGVTKLGTVDSRVQIEAGKPKMQDAVLNRENVDVKRRGTIEDDILAVSAAYKYGIVWHSTEVVGGSGVPYEKPGDGELIAVRTKYCMARIHRIVCVNPQHMQSAYNTHECTHRTRAHPATYRNPNPQHTQPVYPNPNPNLLPLHATDVCVNMNAEG